MEHCLPSGVLLSTLGDTYVSSIIKIFKFCSKSSKIYLRQLLWFYLIQSKKERQERRQ